MVNTQAFSIQLVRLTSFPMDCFKHALAVNTQVFLFRKSFSMHLWCAHKPFHLGNESSMRTQAFPSEKCFKNALVVGDK